MTASTGRQPPFSDLLARLLRGLHEQGLDPDVSRTVGRLCEEASTSDVVDAHVALLAHGGDLVVTSDAKDLRKLLRAARSNADLRSC